MGLKPVNYGTCALDMFYPTQSRQRMDCRLVLQSGFSRPRQCLPPCLTDHHTRLRDMEETDYAELDHPPAGRAGCCLTAKDPGVVEMEATVVDGVPLPATWNVFEGVTPGVNPDMKDIPKS